MAHNGPPPWVSKYLTARPSGDSGWGSSTSSKSLCPAQNGTTYESNQQQYNLYCNIDFSGFDLSTTSASSLQACMAACDKYVQTEQTAGGANCVAVTWSGSLCYMKYRIEYSQVNWNSSSTMSGKRVQYSFDEEPVHSAFGSQTPLATTAATTSATTSAATSTGGTVTRSTFSTATSKPAPGGAPVSSKVTGSTPSPTSQSSSGGGGLSAGAAAGIGVGVTLGVLLLVGIAACFIWYRRRNKHPGYAIGKRETQERPPSPPKHEMSGHDARFELPSSDPGDLAQEKECTASSPRTQTSSPQTSSPQSSTREPGPGVDEDLIVSPTTACTELPGDKEFYPVSHYRVSYENDPPRYEEST